MENLNKFVDTRNFGETNIANSRKKGSLLEWFIKRIFQTIGFHATNMVSINNNQIDVFVNYNDIKILVQCKQYEKSTPPVKDLIHEWNSKRIEIGCDKALLVLWGYPKIEDSDSNLAKKLKVYLWNDTLITYFFDLILSDVNKARNEILLDLEIDNEEVKKILNSIKVDIKNRFRNFSTENKEIVDCLKDEIIDCYKDGILIKQKKFEIIWELLKNKRCFIEPNSSLGDHVLVKRKKDFDIKIYKDEEGNKYMVVYSLLGALAKDGISRLQSKDIFD
ncbi:restriction endonuclease [Candidatus Woesearchaeota archaeon]|nr:restriction endonuclease [Candidatus Woesearchaeota archaeon]